MKEREEVRQESHARPRMTHMQIARREGKGGLRQNEPTEANLSATSNSTDSKKPVSTTCENAYVEAERFRGQSKTRSDR